MMKKKDQSFFIVLTLYHLMFAAIAWHYSLATPGDAYHYWHLTKDWKDYFHIGPDVIRLINYPFSKILKLPFWVGFVLYSSIGLYAILGLYRFSLQYTNARNQMGKYLLLGVFLLPNLHFWTSVVGKEAIIFLSISWIIIHYAKREYGSLKHIAGWLLLASIRPHVALFLLLAIGMTEIFAGRKWDFKKLAIMGLGVLGAFGLYLMTLHLLNRNPFDIGYILERNDASLIAFKRAGSYVPMIEYNWLERIVALNFRPFFERSASLYSLVLSLENVLVVIILSYAGIIYARKFKTIKLGNFARIAIWFFLISSLFFIQRYSCLGIFVRTKIMYLPFLLITALQIIAQIKSPHRDQT